ncbi:hypothetical protein PbJCM13498_08160 [Prolixibacter bellariivorans]|jgi:hypothetical protein|uniref:Uncharacterized protein n=1 Tax=Prolixibacter bellariivorans TaxID=314319 RepID=A0A5M4AWE0_9BACT|nr:hypothetical protein [Prolixibacter bellariivorans]GET31953.1 hypothetical protein PbJCM13498_08160 [Prolixibacter bellariivorans]
MEKNLNAPEVTFKKSVAPSQFLDVKSKENDLLMETEWDNLDEYSDFGELEDLNQIYGDIDEIL